MIQAPLQLRDYWVDFIQTQTNKDYDPKSPADLDLESITAEANVKQWPIDQSEESGTVWAVDLVIEQKIPHGKNIPYAFKLDLSGFVAVHPSLSGEKLENVIQVNGPALLFGVAREIIRAATGRGPFAPVLIPSTNFLARLPGSPKEGPGAKELTTKRKSPTNSTKKTAKKKAGTKRS